MELLIASSVLLWLVVIGLSLLVLGLARQVGLLHERSAPLGAMVADKGPEVGDRAPEFELQDFFGRPIKVGGVRESRQDTLLLFVSPTCPMCNKLLPTARSMAKSEHLDVIVISDGAHEEHERFLKNHHLGDLPYVVTAEVGMRYRVGRVPHAVLIDADGVIRSKGLVNTREHLESLVEAKALNHPSIQDYLRAQSSEAGAADAAAARQLN